MKYIVFILYILFYIDAHAKESISIKGKFLFEFLHEIKFALIPDHNFKNMVITFEGSRCLYEVDQISLPHLPSGRMGKIYTNKTEECSFANESGKKLLKSLTIIDFRYTINNKKQVVGRVSVSQNGKRQSFKIKALE